MSPLILLLVGVVALILVTSNKPKTSVSPIGGLPMFERVKTNREIEHEQDVAMLDQELSSYKRNEHAKAVLAMRADVAAAKNVKTK